ncbi:aminotransferase class IV family protein [Achromobacter deleyi]|uniref:aminotransferase class IV family protein n=1 Tax=Achromobacter deleyi TaxID=1353891 RepID=UPI001492A2EC|nr:aminotransferase class IV family protein [Achromobacter deleyi]QVQ24421.1 aminotransferase class IV family protein [Achromobacter deleyi]UIP19954.1 aminotransferase class IV family protein [Achromobacter deleyi]
MSVSPASFVIQRNGQAATANDLGPLAFAGYAHFTAMQVRAGRVRGLDLHLARLRAASMEMFGQALPDVRIREYLRTAIQASPADHSLTATVYSPAGEFTVAGPDAPLQVLVRTAPPSSGPAGPLALAAVEHERALPQVKHVGEVAKTYFLRQAVELGFDDAAFVDRHGRLSEASIWNLAFWDGKSVVWPHADMLGGTTMGIVRRQLDGIGVPQRAQAITLADLPAFAGAAVMNSWTPGVPVNRIGAVDLPDAPVFLELLHRAYQEEAPVLP